MPDRASPPAEQLVTASDLVRHFGLWQERAARAPIYILHRGRPRFVMTSVETMEALCSSHSDDAMAARTAASDGIDATALLDGVGDIVLIADEGGAIIASSRSARAHFGAVVATGAPVDGIADGVGRAMLRDTVRRVIASGVGQRLDIPSIAHPGRMLAFAVEPMGAGVALFAWDRTTEREHADTLGADRALEAAMLAATGMARATIDPRGYIVDPGPALVALTGLEPAALAQIRFVTLVEAGGRAALGAAIEQTLSSEPPAPFTASLLVNRADPVPVRIALVPVQGGNALALILTESPDPRD